MRKQPEILLILLAAIAVLIITTQWNKHMKTMKVALIGNEILVQRSKELTDIRAASTQQLAKELQSSFEIAKATGFAAPQIFQPVRMMIIGVSAERAKKFNYPEAIPTTILINPTLEPLGSEIVMTWEGCYSIPKMMGLVPRYNHIRYTGTTPDGKFISREATGFHAFIVQHELDHLDGFLYPMRMKDLTKFGYVEEFKNRLPPQLVAEYIN